MAVLPVTQTIFADDPGGRMGNCLQAAVAALLELPLETVPHFVEHDDWFRQMTAFAAAHGYRVERCDDEPIDQGLAFGMSPRGVNHAVVLLDDAPAWDPHPSRAGLLSETMRLAFVGAAATRSELSNARQMPDLR